MHFIVFDAVQYLAHAARRWVLSINTRIATRQPHAQPHRHRHAHPHVHTHFIFQHALTLAPRYATARVDNLCEDWSGDYFPHEGQDPHRIYVQPFCTTEYHPKPHAHGIYAGPYSLRRRCMGGLAAHRLVECSSIVLYCYALHRC